MQYDLSEYTEKSLVLRPLEVIQPVEHLLTGLATKNMRLKAPDGKGILPGYVISKKNEEKVRAILDNADPNMPEPGSVVLPGYQKISYIVLKPSVGQKLILQVGIHRALLTVKEVFDENGITTKALVEGQDGNETYIQLVNDTWRIPGYKVHHTVDIT